MQSVKEKKKHTSITRIEKDTLKKYTYVKIFRRYLVERSVSPYIESIKSGDLDSAMCNFYIEARIISDEL